MTTYREAGVDIQRGDEFVKRIGPLVRSTFRPEVDGRCRRLWRPISISF